MKSGSVGIVSPLSEAALACQKKMLQAHVRASCQKSFLESLRIVEEGSTLVIPEDSILPVKNLLKLSQLEKPGKDAYTLLHRVVMLKLNGGLGTGMGLNCPKSLIEVKNRKTFLDFIVNHFQWISKSCESTRQMESISLSSLSAEDTIPTCNSSVAFSETTAVAASPPERYSTRFMLMNSFKTSVATKDYLRKYYPHLFSSASQLEKMELMQNQVPKVLQSNFFPVEWPSNPLLEWVPPGHGDIFTTLYDSGTLDALLLEGFEYLFISNSDNLGGTVDVRILQWIASNKIPFVMEVCQRMEGDQKGGHIARCKENPSLYVLREFSQCPEDERKYFQDLERHPFFNTNNVWIHLPALKEKLVEKNGVFCLPVLQNRKTVDPADRSSPRVFQLETALGSAISLFPGGTAIVVPRDHFAPVKHCSDLLVIRSDAYVVTPSYKLVLDEACQGVPPVVVLDDYYRVLTHLEELVAHGVPSLRECRHLSIKGKVQFGGGSIVLKGNVIIENARGLDTCLIIPDGTVINNTAYTGA